MYLACQSSTLLLIWDRPRDGIGVLSEARLRGAQARYAASHDDHVEFAFLAALISS